MSYSSRPKTEPENKAAAPKSDTEMLYAVCREDDEYIITGFTERTAAERRGICHLTVIIVPFIQDGINRGKWLVHDRTAKLWAKGRQNGKTPSYNLFGGHCTADVSRIERVGKPVPLEICGLAANRELQEELLCRGNELALEVWTNKQRTDSICAASYEYKPLLPIGYASYTGDDNVEISYVYALPVPAEDVDALIAADDYIKDGSKRNVALPVAVKSEAELMDLHLGRPEVEICDAITRLWDKENRDLRRKLKETIRTGRM